MAENIAFYRTKTAFQFSLINAQFDDKGFVSKTGALLINAANGNNKKFDWSKKISFALGQGDIPQLLQGMYISNHQGDINVSLVHDPGAGGSDKGKITKTLKLKAGEQRNAKDKTKTYGLALTETNKDPVYMYMSQGELVLLEEVIKAAIPFIYGFKR